MASTDALPVPRKNVAYRYYFTIPKSDGTVITGWAGAAAIKSLDGAATGGTTNTPTEIGSSGLGYLDLTSTEMNVNCIIVKVTVTNTGAINLVFTLYPAADVDIRANVVDWSGTAVAAADTAGYPVATIKRGTSAGELDIVLGRVKTPASLSGTASAGTSNTITLTGGVATDSLYKYSKVTITGGTGAGQTRYILKYVGSTKVATVNKPWSTTPDNTSTFDVIPDSELHILQSGVAQAGGASTITLESAASSDNAAYAGSLVFITGGTGTGQVRVVASYVGSTQVATVSTAWGTAPDSTSVYEVLATGRVQVDDKTGWPDESGVTTLLARLTALRAGYLDNLNVGGAVASHADIDSLNQSASRRLVLTILTQWERPESGSQAFSILLSTYDGDGAPVNADTTPTLTATGTITGSLAGHLSVASNPATGLYLWTYTVQSTDNIEQVRLDAAATIATVSFTIVALSQVVDQVSATWNATNAAQLTAIYGKLPSRTYLAGSAASTGAVDADVQTGLSSQGYSTARAAFLDILNTLLTNIQTKLDATISSIETYGQAHWTTAVITSLLTSAAFNTEAAILEAAIALTATSAELSALQTHGDATWATGAAAPTVTAIRQEIDSHSTQLAAIRAQTDLISADSTTFQSPVDPSDLLLTLVKGDTYTTASGRTLPTWSDGDWASYSLLTATSLTLKIRDRYDTLVTDIAAEEVDATTVRAQLTATQTMALDIGKRKYLYALVAVLSSGDVVTLATGEITVVDALATTP